MPSCWRSTGRLGLESAITKIARKIATGSTGTLALLYPQWDIVGVYLSQLWSVDQDETRRRHRMLGSIAGKDMPTKHPGLSTAVLVDHWEKFATDFFSVCMALKKRGHEAEGE